MKSLLQKFWSEESGVVLSLEAILYAILLVLGLVAGMQVMRDAVAMEIADLGMAIGAINNSYTVTGIAGNDTTTIVTGWSFVDASDEHDDGSTGLTAPGGLLISQANLGEN